MTIEIIQTIPLQLFPEPEKERNEDPEQFEIWNERLKKELHQCEMICSHAGIVTGKVTAIRINPRLNSAWGRCITDRTEKTHVIEINKALMGESVPNLSLKATILHELCHTVKDGHGHKKGWLTAAERLKKVYGLRLSRATSTEELSIKEEPDKQVPGFVFRCVVCGAVVKRTRHSKFVDHVESYRCGNCGGRFERI